jgi:nitroreductase
VELMDALRTRRSVRRYTTRLVERDTLEMLLEAAALAPSAGNSQPWAFGVVQGTERVRVYSDRAKALFLVQSEEDASAADARARMSDPATNVYRGAPTLVAIYAKTSGTWAMTDCAMAAQNLMLAAHAHGLGTCWIGWGQSLFDSAELKRELGVPAEYRAVGQLIVGYPEGELPPSRGRNAPEVLFWQ